MPQKQSSCEKLLAHVKSLQKKLLENSDRLGPKEKNLICEQIRILHEHWKKDCAPRGKVVRKTKGRDD